jgi:hypothetical protein
MIERKRKIVQEHLELIKSDIFKILPLFEEKCETLTTHIGSLLYEMYGKVHVIEGFDGNARYLTLLSILESLYDESLAAEYDISTVRREVFKCLNIIEKLQQKAGE